MPGCSYISSIARLPPPTEGYSGHTDFGSRQDCKRPGAVFVLGMPAKVWPNSSTASSADILHLAFWSREPKKKKPKKRLEPKWLRTLHTLPPIIMKVENGSLQDSFPQWGHDVPTSMIMGGRVSPIILLVEEILHQLIWWISHYLQGFIHVWWCRISSINSISEV